MVLLIVVVVQNDCKGHQVQSSSEALTVARCRQVTHQHGSVSRCSGYPYHWVIWNKIVNVPYILHKHSYIYSVMFMSFTDSFLYLADTSTQRTHTSLLLTHYILSVKSLEDFPRWMDSFLGVEEKKLAGWICASISYFHSPHTPPTLPHLTRISQIGCDSLALAVES